MGMVIPMPWSTKMNKATINSIKIKNESLEWQKQMRMRHRYDFRDANRIKILKRNMILKKVYSGIAKKL
jgi:hypothetical protein